MKFATLVVVALVVFVAWAGIPVSLASDGRDLSSVNGEVTASAGETYGSLSTVNGSVHVSRGVTADRAKTVNGEIEVENNVKIGELATVNGSVPQAAREYAERVNNVAQSLHKTQMASSP